MSTQRSTCGSFEGPPSRTLVLKESGASKNEEQKEEAGPRADLMRERSLFLSAFNWPSNVALRPGSEFADWGIGFDARTKAATQVAIGGQMSPDSSIEVKINQFWTAGLVQVDWRVQAMGRRPQAVMRNLLLISFFDSCVRGDLTGSLTFVNSFDFRLTTSVLIVKPAQGQDEQEASTHEHKETTSPPPTNSSIMSAKTKMAIDFGGLKDNMSQIFAKHSPAMVPKIPAMLAQVKQMGLGALRGLVQMTKQRMNEDLEVPFFDLLAVQKEMTDVFNSNAPAMLPKVNGMLGSLSRGDFTLSQLSVMLKSKYNYDLKTKSAPQNILSNGSQSSAASSGAPKTESKTANAAAVRQSRPTVTTITKETITQQPSGVQRVIQKTVIVKEQQKDGKIPTANGWSKDSDFGTPKECREYLEKFNFDYRDPYESKRGQKIHILTSVKISSVITCVAAVALSSLLKEGLGGSINLMWGKKYYPQGGKEIKLNGTYALTWLTARLKESAEKKNCDWKAVQDLVFDKQYWAEKKWKSDKEFKKILIKCMSYNCEKQQAHTKKFVTPELSDDHIHRYSWRVTLMEYFFRVLCPCLNEIGNVVLKGIVEGVIEPDYLECGLPTVMMWEKGDQYAFEDLRASSYVMKCLLFAKLGKAPGMFSGSKGKTYKALLKAVFNADIKDHNDEYTGELLEEIKYEKHGDQRDNRFVHAYLYQCSNCNFKSFSNLNAGESLALPHFIKRRTEISSHAMKQQSRSSANQNSSSRLREKLAFEKNALQSHTKNGMHQLADSSKRRIRELEKQLAKA
eukprot:jgi/Bigna1/67783/fgenesh1_pg.4_\